MWFKRRDRFYLSLLFLVRLSENESRQVGTKFEELVELSPERSEWGL